MESSNLQQLIQVVKKLRDPESGCPWDLEQTHESLLKFLIEESYEFSQAVDKKDDQKMEEEIGDVLLQVVLHAQLASERGAFDLESVAKEIADKMIRRHPHIFDADASQIDSAEVKKRWQEIKQEERKGEKNYAINDKHLAAPALQSADKIGQMTSKLNFDWSEASQVAYKVEEEWQELKEEMIVPGTQLNKERIAEEMGDFLFSTAQLARHAGLEPEEVLHQANQKFVRRFNRVEDLMRADGHDFSELNQEQLDHYWNQTKDEEKNQ